MIVIQAILHGKRTGQTMLDFCGTKAASQEKRRVLYGVRATSSDERRAQLRANSEQNTVIETDRERAGVLPKGVRV